MSHPAIPDNHFQNHPSRDDEPLLSVKDVATRLGCGESTVWRLVRLGYLPVIKIGALTRWAPADVRALIKHRRIVKGGVR